MSQAVNSTRRHFDRLARVPGGLALFSRAVGLAAPFFASVQPKITHFESGRIEVSMKKRRGVLNHIGTVHAIACCNLCEFAMGMLVELHRPATVRWIPSEMNVRYLQKAKTDLHAVATLPDHLDWLMPQTLVVSVSVFDEFKNEVVQADIHVKLSPDNQTGSASGT